MGDPDGLRPDMGEDRVPAREVVRVKVILLFPQPFGSAATPTFDV